MMFQIFIPHVDTGNNNDGDTDACGWATQKWFPKSPLQKKSYVILGKYLYYSKDSHL